MSSPIILDASTSEQGEEKRVDVFSVPNPAYAAWQKAGYQADEAPPEQFLTYSIPAEVNPVIGLEFGERSNVNAPAANSWLIREVVGDEGYEALVRELKKMSPRDAKRSLSAVADKIASVALGN